MDTKTRNIVIGAVIVVLVLVLGYFAWKERTNTTAPASMASTTSSVASSTEATSTSAYTIKQVPLSAAPATPDYRTPLVCVENVSADNCALFKQQAATYASQITANTVDPYAWVNLGTVREEAGDYSGALAAWQYVARLYPSVPTAFDNIADLYATYLKDYPKAESNWQTAIKVYPGDPAPYANLFNLYTTTSYVPSATAAVDILKQGIAANPKAVNLQVLLARYYKAHSDTAGASAEYAAAIANAQAQGQTTLATELQQESK